MERRLELDDRIEVYTDANFSAAAAAQRFFAQYGEQEIAKKLHEMTKIQQDIETELKINVKSNYPAFLEATEQIHKVGSEMATLRHLIDNTEKLIQDVRSTRLSDARVMRSNSLLPAINFRKARDDLLAQQEMRLSSQRETPVWLTKSADELAQYIVEQQYQKAVNIVLKVRTFVAGLDRSASTLKAQQVLDVVNSRCEHLAATIKSSLLTLPHSPLWGSVEQFKRLKLLVSLGELSMAAEGFALVKRTNMRRALYSLDICPDPVLYAQTLSRLFYSELAQCVHTFYQVFEQNQERRQVAALIIHWIQNQIADYVRLLIKQLKLGVAETAALLVLHFRHLPDLHPSSIESDVGTEESAAESVTGRVPVNRASLRRLSSTLRPMSAVPSVLPSTQGGLTLISQALHVAGHFCAAYQSQFNLTSSSSGATAGGGGGGAASYPQVVPLRSFVVFYALNDLQRMSATYIQHFVEDVTPQVRQDTWVSQKICAAQARIRLKGQAAEGDRDTRLVSSSFCWILSVLGHLLDEINALLNGPDNLSFFPENSSRCSYSRADVCEMECQLFAAWIRVLLRYVIEMEGLDLSGFTKTQLLCFQSTLLTVSQCLVPSVGEAVEKCFLVEKMQLLPSPPAMIIKTLQLRLTRMLNDVQSMST